jgi:hypothetical protein
MERGRGGREGVAERGERERAIAVQNNLIPTIRGRRQGMSNYHLSHRTVMRLWCVGVRNPSYFSV